MRFFSYLTGGAFLVASGLLFSIGANAQTVHSSTTSTMGVSVNKADVPDTEDQSVIERGRYLAIASDCTACHTNYAEGKDSEPFAGGLKFKFPMGVIVTSNITPSKEFGIGNWSEEQFARAVRDGISADGSNLYPAMPYTEYSLITDEDIHALYVYFMNEVKPVDKPVSASDLKFPFDMPGAMKVWNLLFLDKARFQPDPSVSDEINRGRYLADGPAHCGTCHTPRNFMMASDNSRYYGGGNVSGWWAPNITPDKIGGIGGWSREDVISYLKTGRAKDKSQANATMAEAVEHSFQHMTDADLNAIAAYLETIPPLPTNGQTEPAYTAHEPVNTDPDQYEFPIEPSSSPSAYDSKTLDGAVLYNTSCAACHGVNGQGADDKSSPSLLQNRAVGISNPDSLIMTIAHGLNRETKEGGHVSMPGFLDSANPIFAGLNREQIASVTNYVRNNFGNIDEKISKEDVDVVLSGGKMPFLIKNAAFLAYSGMVIGVIVLLLLIYRFVFGGRFLVRKDHTRSSEEKNAAAADTLDDTSDNIKK